MTIKYINNKTSPLYRSSTNGSREMILIFGDEVKTSGSPVNGRVQAEFRERKGFISGNHLGHLGNEPALEIYFIDVGQGDSTFIVTPNRKKILIDGGVNKRAFGFMAWKYRLDKEGSPVDIDLLVLSHADGDHIDGLAPIIHHPKINVRKIIHNGIATFKAGTFDTTLGDLDTSKKYLVTRHDSLDDLSGLRLSNSFDKWRQAIADERTPYNAVDSAMGSINIGDPEITIEVLGPRLDVYQGKPVYRWFNGEAPTINGHSVVLRLNYGDVSVLFSGDLNSDGAKYLLEDTSLSHKLDAHVFKSPHHGSHDFHRPFLGAVRPQISVISSGDDPDHGHPRAVFIGAIGQVSRSTMPLVFSTEIAATFVEAGIQEEPNTDTNLKDLDPQTPDANSLARNLFKRRLHGMINVRTDGKNLYAARRVAAGYSWESYGPLPVA
jgi:Metallo-beta-lactamase superfamily